MSKQIYFFHTERDTIHLLQEIEMNDGVFLVNSKPMLPTLLSDLILQKMETHSCSFNIIPKSLAYTDGASVSNAFQIEFKNCCKGNKLSRTYEVGRFFLMPYCDGTYVTESMQLYNVLTKYIRATYSYKKKAAAWLSPEFLEKYRTHYFFALRAGQPVNDYE